MADPDLQILSEAIARNSAAVLSLPSAGLLRHHKSRFLSDHADGFWVEAAMSDRLLIEELLATRVPVGISFKSSVQKVVFASPALQLDPEHRVNATTIIPALLIANPAHVKAIQRRSNYRVRVFDDCELSARVWRIAPRARLNDRPMAAQEIQMQLRDLSIGGLGVTFIGTDGNTPKITLEDRLRIEVRYKETAMLLEGTMRPPAGPQPPGKICSGIRFKDMGKDIEGRQKLSQLTRILGDLQREEARRARMGLA